MNFINPYELLNIDPSKVTDSNSINKAKRKKLAEIELSDEGSIQIKGSKITKSDFYRVTDELDNPSKSDFYLFINSNEALNALLTEGNSDFFNYPRQESIYNDPFFIDFISPFFAGQFNHLFYEAFQNGNISGIKKMVANLIPVNNQFKDLLYRNTYTAINEKIQDLDKTKATIENEESLYNENNINRLIEEVQEKINIELLNTLPPYFQNLRNHLAKSLRNLAVAIFNNFDDSQTSLDIISFASKLTVDGLTKLGLQKDFEQIKNINDERVEASKYKDIIKDYAFALTEINSLNKQLDTKGLTVKALVSKIDKLFIIDNLNSLPDVLSEIREQIALGIQNLSVGVWNYYADIETAFALINKAQLIKVSQISRASLNKTFSDLNIIRLKRLENDKKEFNQLIQLVNQINSQVKHNGVYSIDHVKVQALLDQIFTQQLIQYLAGSKLFDLRQQLVNEVLQLSEYINANYVISFLLKFKEIAKNDPNLYGRIDQTYKNAGLRLQKEYSSIKQPNTPTKKQRYAWVVGAAIVVIVILSLINSNSDNSSYRSAQPFEKTNISSPADESDTISTSIPIPAPIIVSKYKGNQLKNGDSPFDACFGKGKYSGSAWINFKNSNAYDAIICLVNVQTEQTIRNEYIQAGADFTMSKIPTGTYYLKVFYGNDWNPELDNICSTKGTFESGSHFSVSDSPSDYLEIENTAYGYTTGEITLYSVANGNMEQRSIDATDFFNN